jgi:hypothetical protein
MAFSFADLMLAIIAACVLIALFAGWNVSL